MYHVKTRARHHFYQLLHVYKWDMELKSAAISTIHEHEALYFTLYLPIWNWKAILEAREYVVFEFSINITHKCFFPRISTRKFRCDTG